MTNNYTKQALLAEGKTKSLYLTQDPNFLIMEFRDDISAFETKKARLAEKGKLNNIFNTFIMNILRDKGIPIHFVEQLSETSALVKKLTMIPVECILRNRASGKLTKYLGIKEGTVLNPPIYENCLKNDELHDPMITESHILTFGWATKEQLTLMREYTEKVNQILCPLFDAANVILVDFKLEFGLDEAGNVTLGDEFTQDGCRLWDKTTQQRFDKDLFRHDLGDVISGYTEVAQRLGIKLS